MLDKMSEKFLKYIIEHKDECNSIFNLPYHANKIGIPLTFIDDICRELASRQYIDFIDGDDYIYAVFLKHKGSVYFSEKRKANILYWKNLAISKISDIIVSAIVAWITALIVA